MATETPARRQTPSPPCVSSNTNVEESNPFQEKMTWVQCENPTCLKWRLVDCSRLKLDLNQSWFCHMNPDPAFRSCSVAQDHTRQDVTSVHSPMPVGSLVLAESSAWPKWPAILSPDPDSGEYVTLCKDGKVKTYHVEFLGNPHTRCWSPFRLVEPYHPINLKEVQLPKGISKKSYRLAFEEATRFAHMECEARLQICHFKPDTVLSDAKKLITEVQDLMKKFKKGPSSQTCSYGGLQLESLSDDSDLEEVGDITDIEGFRFVSAPTKQGLMIMDRPGPTQKKTKKKEEEEERRKKKEDEDEERRKKEEEEEHRCRDEKKKKQKKKNNINNDNTDVEIIDGFAIESFESEEDLMRFSS